MTRPGPASASPLRRLACACALGVVLAGGCASTPEPDEEGLDSAEAYYEKGLEALKGRRVLFFLRDVDSKKAIEYFQNVIDNYPYSDYAVLSELRIADTHFDEHAYAEAQSYYQDFVELHPNHPKVPYAIYRNGLCSHAQMRASDRDQKATREAASQFQVLLERFPDAEEAGDARVKLAESRDRLARHEVQIGDFYYAQGTYHAAVQRYQRALDNYPEHDGNLETQARLGLALAKLGRPVEAERVLRSVLQRGAQDDLREEVEEQLEELARIRASGATPQPSS